MAVHGTSQRTRSNVSAGNVNAYVPQWISESLTGDELASITHGSKCIGHPITSEKASYYAYIAEKLAGAIQTYGVSRQTIITANISKGATPAKMVLGNHGLLLENLNISKESMGSLDNYISESSIDENNSNQIN